MIPSVGWCIGLWINRYTVPSVGTSTYRSGHNFIVRYVVPFVGKSLVRSRARSLVHFSVRLFARLLICVFVGASALFFIRFFNCCTGVSNSPGRRTCVTRQRTTSRGAGRSPRLTSWRATPTPAAPAALGERGPSRYIITH